MGIRDFFGKRDSKVADSVTRLNLSDLKPGWMVDHMGRTYEVTAYNAYEWGEDDRTDEWQLKDGTETVYLEREFDDEDDWSLNRKISFRGLGPGIAERIAETGDPPEELVHEGRRYYLEEAAGGHFLKDGKGLRQPMLRWSYEDDEGENYLGIEQWEEEEFEASVGQRVHEHQFTNILPR